MAYTLQGEDVSEICGKSGSRCFHEQTQNSSMLATCDCLPNCELTTFSTVANAYILDTKVIASSFDIFI